MEQMSTEPVKPSQVECFPLQAPRRTSVRRIPDQRRRETPAFQGETGLFLLKNRNWPSRRLIPVQKCCVARTGETAFQAGGSEQLADDFPPLRR
jgi:hypothetical protein